MKYENLFKPIKIGPVEIKNRIGMAPMNLFYSEPDGSVSEQQMAYYAARAKGGVGLIVTEAIRTSIEGVNRTFYANLRLFDVNWQNKMSELFETIHCFGAKVFAQINIGPGPQGFICQRIPNLCSFSCWLRAYEGEYPKDTFAKDRERTTLPAL